MNYGPSHSEVLVSSVKQLVEKFPGAAEEVTQVYTNTYFPRLPPIPYLFIFNDAFFGFLRHCTHPSHAIQWLKSPPFEAGLAAHAKLPQSPYLSGFNPFAYQHRPPTELDTTGFEHMLKLREVNNTVQMCNDFKQQFKIENKMDDQAIMKCKKCLVGVLQSFEKRMRMGADEPLQPMTKCLNCGEHKKL